MTAATLDSAPVIAAASLARDRSTPRRVVAAALLEHLDALAGGCAAELASQFPSYEQLPQLDQIARAVVAAMALAMGGERPNAQLVEYLRKAGEERGMRGAPLHEVLRGHDLIAGIVWEATLEELLGSTDDAVQLQEASMQMSVALLELTSRINSEVSEAYLEAEQEFRATAEQARRDIFEELLCGTALGLQALRDRAQRAGCQLGDAHAVLLLSLEVSQSSSRVGGGRAAVRGPSVDDAMRAIVCALRGVALGAPAPLVQARGGVVRAILPVAAGTTDRSVRAVVAAALEEVALPADAYLLGAVGRVERAVPGIAMSWSQAQRAHDAAHACGRRGIECYADSLPTLALLQDPGLARDVYRSTVEPLFAHDAAHGTELVVTLEAFLEERGILAAAAKRLFVHRHTLAPRLERIEALCGRSLRERDDLMMYELGLRAQGLVRESRLGGDLARPAAVPSRAPGPAPARMAAG